MFLVLISRDSLGSNQIGIEVVRAHETNKRFFPVPRGVSHAEFHARQPEWEKARGTDGRRYPWGESWDDSRVNGSMTAGGTRPVGSYPGGASPYDIQDMAGNVGEWIADWFHGSYYQQSPERNPQGPRSGDARVLRGGARAAGSGFLRSAYRYNNPPEYRDSTIGFRCAKGVSQSPGRP